MRLVVESRAEAGRRREAVPEPSCCAAAAADWGRCGAVRSEAGEGLRARGDGGATRMSEGVKAGAGMRGWTSPHALYDVYIGNRYDAEPYVEACAMCPSAHAPMCPWAPVRWSPPSLPPACMVGGPVAIEDGVRIIAHSSLHVRIIMNKCVLGVP